MIAPEGKIILIPLLLLVLVGTGIQAYYPSEGLKWINLALAEEEMGSARQISIFLSIFSIHSQRVPISGKVISKQYNPGNFLLAFNHKASMDNEHTAVLFETENGKRYKIKQIAGFIARRILNYMEPENLVQRGQRLGFIRFGSRVDIILPRDFQIDVSLGDMVQGNKTIIGQFQ